MIIKEYEKKERLLDINVLDTTDEAGVVGYRGRLALVEAEAGDASGHRKVPSIVMEQTIMLSKEDKLLMLAGWLDRVEDLSALVSLYKADFSADMLAILYVLNLTKAVVVELEGIQFSLMPLEEGLVWNKLMDEALLEKSDFKKMSSAQKVQVLYQALKGYQAEGEAVSLEQAQAYTADIKREGRGAL